MKIAIVHEMLIKLWGAEKVLQEFMHMYPLADVFTLMYDEKKVGSVFPKNRIWCDTPAQKLFSLTGKPRLSLPLMPISVKKIDLTEYDIIISSSSGFAHGVQGRPDAKHICYCHSPARYLWDATEEVQKEIGVMLDPQKKHTPMGIIKSSLGWPIVTHLFDYLRKHDREASKKPTMYIANSREVQNRIHEYYQRDSLVLWPPVDVSGFTSGPIPVSKRAYYVITSALTPFKKVDRAIRVMTKLGLPLKIIGEGAQRVELQKIAGNTIEFLGRISDEEKVKVYMNARGFLMPQKEDAGIAPIEAMAAGIPVFGLAKGWLLEVNMDGATGRFFPEETDESFKQYFMTFDAEITAGKYDASDVLIDHAYKFDTVHFRDKFQEVVKEYVR
jgi:glycosyltransferase involved in cell wall biosynthesis